MTLEKRIDVVMKALGLPSQNRIKKNKLRQARELALKVPEQGEVRFAHLVNHPKCFDTYLQLMGRGGGLITQRNDFSLGVIERGFEEGTPL